MPPLLQRIQADQSTEFNGMEVSFGIAPILATISDMFQQLHKPPIDVFVINVETIIRDRMKTVTKDTVLDRIADKVISDIIVMIHYISTYNRLSQDNHRTEPCIFVYLARYDEGIPITYKRDKLPKYTKERWYTVDRVVAKLRKRSLMGECNGTRVHISLSGGKKYWPHMELMKDISNSMNPKFASAYMVSHAPIDFHIYRAFKTFNIIESYTGKTKSIDDLGRKVFNVDGIPFNKYTHLLLGDKWLIGSKLKHSEKKRVQEAAIDKQWHKKSDMLILKDIINMGIVSPSILTQPNI